MARAKRRERIRAEINLTPLIDVMTCLLAIFMLTAPMLTSGIPLDLPKGDGKQIEGNEKTLDISVDSSGQIFVGTEIVSRAELIDKVRAIVTENPSISMVISGDKSASYGAVIEVMALLRSAGYTQVGLKTDSKIVRQE